MTALPEHTVTIYTDGSKLEDGSVGCGWVIYHCRNQQLHQVTEGRCHLGRRAEVYDAELHAVQEAVTTLLTTTIARSSVFICIDNQAAINTLQHNNSNHEFARRTLEVIARLQLLGWQISTVWCPSHCNIPGNEKADTLAKMAASATVPCRFALTTKYWLLAQARKGFLERWKKELPLSNPSFKFPCHLQHVDWTDTRAMWRVFCNRSPSDPPPNITADPCPCGLSLNSSHHLLQECVLLTKQRTELLQSTTGDIQTASFLTAPRNVKPICRFLRATGLGHSTHLCFDNRSHDSPMNDADDTSSDSPEPEFGAFEP